MTPDDLEAIRERFQIQKERHEEANTPPFRCCSAHDSADDVPALLAALAEAHRRLRALETICGCEGEPDFQAQPGCPVHGEVRTLLDDLDAKDAALAEAQRERDEARRLAELTAEQVAVNAQIIDEERRLMRPVVEAARALREQQRRDYLGPEATAAELWEHASDFRRVREAFEAAVDTYETQTGGTDGTR